MRERPEQRKWIYNPNIHGPSEEEFRKHIDLYFKVIKQFDNLEKLAPD